MKPRAIGGLNCGQQDRQNTEDIMHPAIIQAAATERARDLRALATAHGRATDIRRTRRALRSLSAVRAGRARRILLAPRAA
jgi:hypothetical protein